MRKCASGRSTAKECEDEEGATMESWWILRGQGVERLVLFLF
jgi:hypothetical protein